MVLKKSSVSLPQQIRSESKTYKPISFSILPPSTSSVDYSLILFLLAYPQPQLQFFENMSSNWSVTALEFLFAVVIIFLIYHIIFTFDLLFLLPGSQSQFLGSCLYYWLINLFLLGLNMNRGYVHFVQQIASILTDYQFVWFICFTYWFEMCDKMPQPTMSIYVLQ